MKKIFPVNNLIISKRTCFSFKFGLPSKWICYIIFSSNNLFIVDALAMVGFYLLQCPESL